MATTPSVRVLKQSGYKGGTKVWSNRYHFNGGTPADATHWHTLMDNIVAAEKLCLHDYSTIIECIGYNAGSDVPVASKTYSVAGTQTLSVGQNVTPLEVCALLRWSTSARSSKNHPIYLFNYIHDAIQNPTLAWGHESLAGTQQAAIDTYASAWISGFSDGSITAVRAGPNGATATGEFCEPVLTHRDFPR